MDERTDDTPVIRPIAQHGQSARRPKGRGAPRADGAGRPAGRRLQLAPEVARRLGVHCACAGANPTREANRILLRYLAQFGQGRRLWAEAPGADGPGADEASAA